MGKRLLAFNGLAILAVVLHHSAGMGLISIFYWTDRYRAVTVPNFDALGSPSYYYLIFIRQIVVFSVPVFLFVSGYFSAYVARGQNITINWKIIKARIIFLIIPYFIWSFSILLLEYFDNGSFYSLGEYLLKLFFGLTTGGYYFVPLLCQFYLLMPLLTTFGKNKPIQFILLTIIIQIVIYSFSYIEILTEWTQPTLLTYFTREWSILRWGIYLSLGIITGFHLEQVKKVLIILKPYLIGISILFGLLSIIEPILVYNKTGHDMRGLPFTYTALFYSMSVILTFLTTESIVPSLLNLLSKLGSKSFGIYLLHGPIIKYSSRIIYHIAPFLLSSQIILQLVLVILGIGLPLLFMKLFANSRVRKYYRYLFG